MRMTVLRPGFLVSMGTDLTGNVSYRTFDIQAAQADESGALVSKWETEKTVSDAAEQERGIKARSEARSQITRLCSQTKGWMLCPLSRKDELEAAIVKAREIADTFNASANVTRLNVSIMVGKVADNDEQALRALNVEMRQLFDDMAAGIQRVDVDMIRTAANKATQMGQVLTPEAEQRVQLAIDSARKLARKMVKAGEQAAAEIDQATLDTIKAARTAFLDLEEPAADMVPVVQESRAIDLAPDAGPVTPAPVQTAPAIEIAF